MVSRNPQMFFNGHMCDILPVPLMVDELTPGIIYRKGNELWFFHGYVDYDISYIELEWGMYVDSKTRNIIYHGQSGIPFQGQHVWYPPEISGRLSFLDDPKLANIPTARERSKTLLRYEIFTSDYAIDRYIKQEVNRRNWDLSHIINVLGYDQTRAYNLYNSLKQPKKDGLSHNYRMAWFKLLGLQPIVTFVPTDQPIEDYEIR
jgi:hypothetical protein